MFYTFFKISYEQCFVWLITVLLLLFLKIILFHRFIFLLLFSSCFFLSSLLYFFFLVIPLLMTFLQEQSNRTLKKMLPQTFKDELFFLDQSKRINSQRRRRASLILRSFGLIRDRLCLWKNVESLQDTYSNDNIILSWITLP